MFTLPTTMIGSSRPTPLADMPFGNIPPQVIAGSSAEWNSNFPTIATPDSIYLFDSAGGVVDGGGSNDLVKSGTPLTQQQAVGLWGGSSFSDYRASEWQANSPASYYTSNSSVFDISATSVAVLIVARLDTATIYKAILGSRNSAPLAGWSLETDNFFNVIARIYDGAGTLISTGGIGDAGDFAWHYYLVQIDTTAKLVRLSSDLGTPATGSFLANPGVTNGQAFRFGGLPALASSQFMQIAAGYVWTGANAETVHANIDGMWTHGSDPTGLLTTATHSSTMTEPAGSNASGDLAMDWAAGQVPMAGLGSEVGLAARKSIANFGGYTDNVASGITAGVWAKEPTTSASGAFSDLVDSPRGIREAQKIIMTAAGSIRQSFGSSAGTRYTVSAYIRRGGGVDTSMEWGLFNANSGLWLHKRTLTLTSAWQFVWATGIAPAGMTLGLNLFINPTTQAFHIWRANVVVGEFPTRILMTSAASFTRTATDYQLAGGVDEFIRSDKGSIRIGFISETQSNPALARTLVDTKGSVSNSRDRRLGQIGIDEKMAFTVGDAVGGVVTTVKEAVTSDWLTKRSVVVAWDSGGSPTSSVDIDGTKATDASVLSRTIPSELRTVVVGADNGAGTQAEGVITSVETFDVEVQP